MLKDRRLLSGFVVVLIGLGVQLLASQSGINVDLLPFEDQVLTLAEALMVGGSILIGLSKKFVESVKAERSGVS